MKEEPQGKPLSEVLKNEPMECEIKDLNTKTLGGNTMNYSLGIIQFPSKRWGYVGSVPVELTKDNEYHDSLVFTTKEGAVGEAEKLGFYSKDGVNFYQEGGKQK